jgi:hypothetical protein
MEYRDVETDIVTESFVTAVCHNSRRVKHVSDWSVKTL